MTAYELVLPIIAVILLFLVVWGIQRALQNRFTRKSHYKVIIAYMTFLLVALIVTEILEQTTSLNPTRITSQEKVDVGRAILSDKSIPENQLAIERTHEVDGKLSIKAEQLEYETIFYIERSFEDGNTVTERVYKPSVTIEAAKIGGKSYDLSQYVKVSLPVWKGQEVVMPFQSKQELVVSAYQDSIFISQLTSNRVRNLYKGSKISDTIVHLIIPEDIELDIQLDPDYYVEVPRY
ncbi:hypothetical protein [Sporosarcina sp. D27]|uniref:hypothetical protein n=1 Tax=Sporosarcina sp. D27 TaxID=1382305 RepID=UPI00047230FC|nr:hypothetical protein [Sporosarcina sp. D27]